MNMKPLDAIIAHPETIAGASCRGLRSNGRSRGIATLLLLVLCLSTGGFGLADEVSKTTESQWAKMVVTASTDTLQVAEPMRVEWTITAPAGTKLTFPAIGDKLGAFNILGVQDIIDIPAAAGDGLRIWKRSLTLDTIATGEQRIPEQEFQVTRDGDAATVHSDSIPIRVISVLEDRADPTRFRDIHSVVDLPVREPESHAWLWWSGGGLGFAAMLIVGFVLIKRRRSWISPLAWAVRELELLEKSSPRMLSDSEEVSRKLSSILRDYLELQFDLAAPEQTTQELLRGLQSCGILEPETIARIGEIFTLSDQAKFAGLTMTPAEWTQTISEARGLVLRTSDRLRMTEASRSSTETN